MAGETIISVTYGIDVLPKNDPYIATAENAIQPLFIAAIPGTFLVDTFPWLKYVPDWMPFAGFKRKAKEWRKLAMAMVENPYKAGKEKIVSTGVTLSYRLTVPHHNFICQERGDITPSFLAYSLAAMNENHDIAYQEDVIKNTAGTLYTGRCFVTCRHRQF
jgi:hypothetical protein